MSLSVETSSALAEALGVFGFGLGAADPGLAATMGGPLSNLIGTENNAPAVMVAIPAGPESNADAVLQSVAGALSRVRPDLELRPGNPVNSLSELAASAGSPADLFPLTQGGAVVGAVVWVRDRRVESGQASPAATAGKGPDLGVLAGAGPLTRLRDVQLNVTVELGRTAMSVSEVLALEIGSVIELDRAAGAPIDVRVNGTLLARGEVVVVDDEYAIRMTEMIDPERG